jgi:uncharacterized membrane protein YdjX (TVP38/TMEM64 family)
VRRWVRPAVLVALVAVAVVVALTVGVPPVEEIRRRVAGAGPAAPVLYALLYAGLTLTPVPVSVVTIAGGVLFGVAVGLPAVLAGALVGAVAGFAVSRYLGRGTAARIGGQRLARLDALLRRRGVVAVIAVRLVPLLPFTTLNVACGLTAVRLRDYVVGTAVGVLPGATAFVTIGAYGADPGSAPFLLAVGGLAVLAVGGLVVARRRRAGREA